MDNLKDNRKKEWFSIENDLVDRLDLDIYEKAVYMVIARFANGNDEAFPSYQTIADRGGMSKRKAQEAVGSLITKGLLSKINRTTENNPSQKTSNLYILKSARSESKKDYNTIFSMVEDAIAKSSIAQDAIPLEHNMPYPIAQDATKEYINKNTNIKKSVSPTETFNTMIEKFKIQISYDEIMQEAHPKTIESVNKLLYLMAETYLSNVSIITIEGEEKNIDIVRSVFDKITKDDILNVAVEYVLKAPVGVKKVKGYLRTILYNAPLENHFKF